MWHELWVAFCLVLVIEGILPFLNPRAYKEAVATLASLDDRTLRTIGLVCMLLGTLTLYLIN